MAIGPRRSPLRKRNIERDYSGRLAQDRAILEATGKPISYRRVPGLASRLFYDPNDPTRPEVSEHYVVRIYRPIVRQELESKPGRVTYTEYIQANRRYARKLTENKLSLAETYQIKLLSESRELTIDQVLKDKRFNDLALRLQVVSYEARHSPIDSALRQRLYAANGAYAKTLYELGRRERGAGFPVGESPLQVGVGKSYIDEVVIPKYQQQ